MDAQQAQGLVLGSVAEVEMGAPPWPHLSSWFSYVPVAFEQSAGVTTAGCCFNFESCYVGGDGCESLFML